MYYETPKLKETITRAFYRRKLSQVLKKSRQNAPITDNVRSYVRVPVKTHLDVLSHPPYSPDTVPSDDQLFQWRDPSAVRKS